MGFELKKDDDGFLINPNGRIMGYVRVSTTDQRTDRQMISMKQYGVRPENIVEEYESGKNFNRPLYKKLVRTLRRGDILVITSIDRLGRNYQDIIDQWRMITTDIGCGIHVIEMPALNTSSDPEDLLSRFITDMMLQVLSFVAENERTNLRKRQADGIAAAKRRGDVDLGRPKIKISRDFWYVYILWREEAAETRELIKYCTQAYHISPRTFYRKLDETHDIFKGIPTNELDTVDFSEFGLDWEHFTGNDDHRNKDTPDLEEHTKDEIMAAIIRMREEKKLEPPKVRKRRKSSKKKKKGTGKRGRPPKSETDKMRDIKKRNMSKTFIVD